MNNTFKEQLKNAICNNDLDFLKENKEKYSIDERFEDKNNNTLLLYSISYVNSFVYSFFLENGANINLVNDEGENIIHAIIYSKDYNRLVTFMQQYTFDINIRMKDGATPLLLAISLGQIEMALFLIHQGADVNIGDNEGITPIHLAAQFNNLDLVKRLIDKGANIYTRTQKGNYPLALAINGDNVEVAKFLFTTFY